MTRWLAAASAGDGRRVCCWRPRRAAGSCNCAPGTVEVHHGDGAGGWRGSARRRLGHGAARGGGFSRARADRGARQSACCCAISRSTAIATSWNARRAAALRRAVRALHAGQRRAGGGRRALAIQNVRFREIAGFAVLVSRSRQRRDRSRAGGRQRLAQRRRAATTPPAASCWRRAPAISASRAASCATSAATASGRTRSTPRRATPAA